jgi:3-hydroxymyristoyl/3-hydroxydecanoyl-(acyl carrier protein) dehydratase
VVQEEVFVPLDHPAFPGHFPGQPLLPGVSLLAEVLEAVLRRPELAALVGASPRLGAAKFLSPVRPGTALTLHFNAGGNGLRFEVKAGERPVASGHFERAA